MTVFNTQNNPCDLSKKVNNTKMTLISIRRKICHFQEKKRYSDEIILGWGHLPSEAKASKPCIYKLKN